MKNNLIRYILLVLILSSCLGIGYASVSGTLLDLDGTATLEKQEGIFITSVSVTDNAYADPTLSEVNNFYQTMMNSRTVLTDNPDSYITYQVTIVNHKNIDQQFEEVVYDSSFYDNSDIIYELDGLNPGDIIPANGSVTFNIKFKYATVQQHYNNTILNSIINFKFKNYHNDIEYRNPTACTFNGAGNQMTGDCATNNPHPDYIDTGIKLFSDENYLKDFEIGFTVDSIDPSRFRSGQVDTIFSNLYEASPYPGITVRIQNSKWFFQVGNGVTSKKLTFEPDAIQSFKIYRVNNRVYYSLNGGNPVFVMNLTGLTNTFDLPVIFGTSLDSNNTPMSTRFLQAQISDFYVRLLEDRDSLYRDQDEKIEQFIGTPLTTVFEENENHVYDGTASTGFDTGVALFSQTNYQKSFVATFMIEEYNHNNQASNQATLFNAKDESNAPNYPGIVFRRGNTDFTLSIKDGSGLASEVTVQKNAYRLNIIKKGMEMYYQYDLSEILPIGNNNSLAGFDPANCFDVGTTFGSNINDQGQFDRIMIGTLSHMRIKLES